MLLRSSVAGANTHSDDGKEFEVPVIVLLKFM